MQFLSHFLKWHGTAVDGKVDYMSENWNRYTGLSFHDSQSHEWSDVIHPDDLDNLMTRWSECYMTGKILEIAARFRKFNGEYRWHLVRGVPVFNKAREISMWVGTNTDIHSQVRQTEELEQKVKERTHLLEETNKELEQFAHISSHDLQEPLRKIQTFADILYESNKERLDEPSKRYVEKIVSTSLRMSTYLKDLLNLAKINNAGVHEAVSLNTVFAQVLEDLELAISQKGASIKIITTLPVVRAVPFHVKQLFYNLINNALKFAKVDVPLTIEISCYQLDAKDVLKFETLDYQKVYYKISVKDNGIGFEQQYAKQIFTLFQRLHGKNAYEGTGIGLALCKRVVNQLNGEIFATSILGEGATFHVILPIVVE